MTPELVNMLRRTMVSVLLRSGYPSLVTRCSARGSGGDPPQAVVPPSFQEFLVMQKMSLLVGAVLSLGASSLEAQSCTSSFGQVPGIPANTWGNTVPTNRAVYNDCVTDLVLGLAARPRGT